jgi:hypothetical protein
MTRKQVETYVYGVVRVIHALPRLVVNVSSGRALTRDLASPHRRRISIPGSHEDLTAVRVHSLG